MGSSERCGATGRAGALHTAARILAGALLVVLVGAAPAPAYIFNEPTVRQIAPQTVPYDWSVMKCNNNDDIPDQPARAFRDVTGLINFVDTHHTMWRNTTTNLTTLTHVCSPIMMHSSNNTDYSKFDDKEWIGSPWTTDGKTVHALVHMEYQGWRHGSGGYCIRSGETWADRQKCWWNAITLVTSTNNGATFSHTTAPSHLVAAFPRQYIRGGGPAGFFQPSNIVRAADGWHYVTSRMMGPAPQSPVSCLMRSRNLADPTSWRGWNGSSFTLRFPNPYTNTLDPAQHVCASIGVGTFSESLTWNTYFKQWMLVGAADNADGSSGPGFYYFLSDDLINWSPATNIMRGELPWTWVCADGNEYVRDPSVLDPLSKSRNFDTTGQRPYLFFTRFNLANCSSSLDRDLIRIPIEFSNQQPGGPSAAVTASAARPQPGAEVTFDASRSRDSDGAITRYEWDLDGNGTYERDTGTTPVAKHVYEAPDAVTVTVRVHDNDGKATDDTTVVEVGGPRVAARAGGAPASVGAVGRTSPAATAQAVGRFRVVRTRARRGAALLRVRVPAAGTLRVRAQGRRLVRPARVTAGRAGLVTVKVRASGMARALLSRRASLRARALLTFTPVGNAPQTAVRTLSLRR